MADRSLAQDPAEPFDVVLADGTSTGRTKTRADVHRDGDWHRSVHVWVAGVDPTAGPFLIAQRRGLAKDTWPGALDATVGGHLRAGERLADALREVEEEIGVVVAAGDPHLRRLGVRVSVSDVPARGVADHELQDVFLLRDDRPLARYVPHPAELAALVRVPLSALVALLAGEAPTAPAWSLAPGATAPAVTTVTAADFIPTVDRYFYRVAVAAGLALRGERHVAV